MRPVSKSCVQATPDCTLLSGVAQVSGAPDAGRWQGVFHRRIDGGPGRVAQRRKGAELRSSEGGVLQAHAR